LGSASALGAGPAQLPDLPAGDAHPERRLGRRPAALRLGHRRLPGPGNRAASGGSALRR
jgi:hypothetical protein